MSDAAPSPTGPRPQPEATWAEGPPAGPDQTLELPPAPAAPDATLALDGRAAPAADHTLALPGSVAFSLSSRAGSLYGPGEIAPLPELPAVPGYDLLGELGRGAMGVVYKARQLGLNRTVALKMILAGGHASDIELRRFKIEAEAIAALSHPHIVAVYEIGEHHGLPYFSLEFIDGGCLADKLAASALPPRQAARVVQQLAGAMAYAHGRGIVHRDLKPANVLLARDGTPKITDFGLAKKVEEDSGATRAGAIMGTPSYMAPEQAEGRTADIGPSADIYALGAILYDLLTGRPPFKGATILETLNQVRTVEPISPARLAPQMPRDLETICLKCLQKLPGQRYHSAADLAADLGRFLAGEPIQARPVPAWERAWKWCKRRPAAAALIAVTALSVAALAVGGLAFGAAQAELRREAERQRGRAEASSAIAHDTVDQFYDKVSTTQLPYVPSAQKLRRDLLEKAADYFEEFLRAEADPRPEVRHKAALVAKKLGDIRATLGDPARAEAAFRRALALLDRLRQDDPVHARYDADHAAVATNLANLLSKKDRAAALALYRQASATQAALLARAPGDAQLKRDLAVTHSGLGLLHQEAGEAAEAEASYREALRLFPTALASDIAGREVIASAWLALGRVRAPRDPRQAEGPFREGLARLDAVIKDTPGAPEPRLAALRGCLQLGQLLEGREPAEADALYARAAGLGAGLVKDYPLTPDHRQGLAQALNAQARRHLAAGRRRAAGEALEYALNERQKLAADFAHEPEYRRELAANLADYALFLRRLARPDEAARYARLAVAAWRGLAAEAPENAVYARELARARVGLGEDVAEAVADLDRLLARDPTSREDWALRAGAYQVLGLQLIATHPAAALRPLAGAETDFRALTGRFPDEPDYPFQLAAVRNLQGEAHRLAGRPKAAEQAWADSRDLFAALARRYPNRPDLPLGRARALHNLGVLYATLSRNADSESAHTEALGIRRELAEKDKSDPHYRHMLATSHAELAIAQARRNRTEPSLTNFRRAIDLLAALEQQHPEVAAYRDELITQRGNYAGLLFALNKDAEALAQWRAELTQREKRAAAAPGSAPLRADVAAAQHRLGLRLREMKRHDDEARALEEAIRRGREAAELAPKDAGLAAALAAYRFALADAQLLRGDHAAAARAVESAAEGAPADWPHYAAAAAALARCAAAAGKDEGLDEARRQARAKAHGDRAVEMLSRAVKAGFRDAAAVRNARDFDAVRDRADFKKILAAMGREGEA